MSDQTIAVERTQSQEPVKANWDALADFVNDTNPQPKKEETPAAKVDADVSAGTEKPEEIKIEDVNPEGTKPEGEVKPAAEAAATKDEKQDEVAPVIEFTVADIKDVPKTYEDGTFQGLASDLGFEVSEESWEKFQETFKEKFISREEAEKLAQANEEKYFSTLPPQVAEVLELRKLGIPDELLLNPTKEIDSFLSLDDAQLVRSALEAQPGWDTDMVDKEMETLAADTTGLLAHKAKVARLNLQNQKKELEQTRTQLVQKYTADKQRAAEAARVEKDTKIIKALNDKSAFMGVPLSPELKAAFTRKYQTGAYEKELSNPSVLADYILYREMGEKLTKHIQAKAREAGKDEITKKLSNIPIPQGGGGTRVQPNSHMESSFDILKEDFGK